MAGLARELQDARSWMGGCVFGGLEEIEHGSWGGICEGCLLTCAILRRRGRRRERKGGGCCEESLAVILFESGLGHEAADFKRHSPSMEEKREWLATLKGYGMYITTSLCY